MITIYTIRNDQTVDCVIDWIEYYGEKYERINSDDFLSIFTSEGLSRRKNNVHWFWKWIFPDFETNLFVNQGNSKAYKNAMNEEYKILFDFYFENYNNCVVNHPRNVEIDKLTQLKHAHICDLHTPDTLITSSKSDLLKFKAIHKSVITKCFIARPTFHFEDKVYKAYTSELEEDYVRKMPKTFFPSLFQEKIEKDFELRIIYVGGKFFSCALIGGNNVDIRMNSNSNEVGIYPYNLPKKIEGQLTMFMNRVGLQIGSIDMLYSKNGKYIFLEVNPSGQFLGYSSACNYQVEKSIAEYLINLYNEKN